MPNVFDSYLILLFLSSAVTLGLSGFLWHRFWRLHRIQPARTFAVMMAAVSFWALGCGLALGSGSPEGTYLWERIKYIGLLLVPPLWLVFSLQWTGRSRKTPRFAFAALYLVAAAFLAAVMSDPFHHLVWSEFRFVHFGPYLFDEVVHGPVWWGIWAYSTALILLGQIYLIGAIAKLSRTYRIQAALLTFGTLLPWVSNLYFASGLSPLLVDVTPTFFILSCLIYIWGFSRFRMIDLIPVARESVFVELNDPIFVLDLDDRILDLNRAAELLTGNTESGLLGRNVWTSVLEPMGRSRSEAGWADLEGGLRISAEGTEKYFEIHVDPLGDPKGRIYGRILMLRDLTERWLAEEKVRSALREKEILLQEIHHRVKNNMQLVVSLLRLQGSRINDPWLRDVFATGENRIRSMALIHEKLYMNKNFARLDFRDFIQDLCRRLWRTYDPTESARLELDLDEVFLGLTQAVPCGLILHELVSNSLLHAFNGEGGSVSVRLRETGRSIELIVADGGRGMPDNFEIWKSPSLGLQLVSGLVEQLGGDMDMRSGNGTTFRITFDRPD